LSYFSIYLRLVGRTNEVLAQEVVIFYKNERVLNLVKSNLTMWNSGNQTIRHEDIVASSPILITLSPDDKVLNASIIKLSLPQNGISIETRSEREVVVDFLYLEPMQGFTIEILHSVAVVRLTGTIMGMRQGITKFDPTAAARRGIMYWLASITTISVIINLAQALVSYLYLPSISQLYVSDHLFAYSISTLLGNAIILVPLLVVAWRKNFIFREPIPKELARLRDVLPYYS
jgi:hypothetical protein